MDADGHEYARNTAGHDPGSTFSPPAINATGILRYSVMAYQSSWVAFHHCEEGKSNLVRLKGRSSTGREAGKSVLPQRARAGDCPCCPIPAHAVAPPSYEAGVHDPPGARGRIVAWPLPDMPNTLVTRPSDGIGRRKASLWPHLQPCRLARRPLRLRMS